MTEMSKTINWKEKAKEVLDNEDLLGFLGDGLEDIHFHNEIILAMIEFAKLACEEQKKICADEAIANIQLSGGYETIAEVDEDSILNAPLVNFK